MNQFQKTPPTREVQYANPFDVLLDRPFKPTEQKAYRPEPEIAIEVAIDRCAICKQVRCNCPNREVIKFKL